MAGSRQGRILAGTFRLAAYRSLDETNDCIVLLAMAINIPPLADRVIAHGRSCAKERGAWCGPSLPLTRRAFAGRHRAPGRRSFRDIQSCAHIPPPCPGRDHPTRPKLSCRVHLSRRDGNALSRRRDIVRAERSIICLGRKPFENGSEPPWRKRRFFILTRR